MHLHVGLVPLIKSTSPRKKLQGRKKTLEIHFPSGPVNFSFHLPLKYYLLTWPPVWKSEDKREQSMLGWLTNISLIEETREQQMFYKS